MIAVAIQNTGPNYLPKLIRRTLNSRARPAQEFFSSVAAAPLFSTGQIQARQTPGKIDLFMLACAPKEERTKGSIF